MEFSTTVDHGDMESYSASEETESDDPAEQSGHIHPAEVFTVTDHSGSSADLPVLNSDPSSMAVTLSTPSMEAEASSPEIITFIPESSASSGDLPLEDIQEKLEQEGLGERPNVFISTNQNKTRSIMEQREQYVRGVSVESSGEIPEVTSQTLLVDQNEGGTEASDVISKGIPHQSNTIGWEANDSPSAPEVTSQTLLVDQNEGGTDASDVKSKGIPDQSNITVWEAKDSPSATQESHSDREYSAEPPVTEERKEQEVTIETTTSNIKSEFIGIPKPFS